MLAAAAVECAGVDRSLLGAFIDRERPLLLTERIGRQLRALRHPLDVSRFKALLFKRLPVVGNRHGIAHAAKQAAGEMAKEKHFGTLLTTFVKLFFTEHLQWHVRHATLAPRGEDLG